MPRNPDNLVKGRFIGSQSRRVIPFMFNPTAMDIDHGFGWGEQMVPLRSHPYFGGGSGENETVMFTLYFDGDRGRQKAAKIAGKGGFTYNPFAPRVPMDVMPEVNAIRSMKLPYDQNLDGAYGVPESFFLSMGQTFHGEVLIRRVHTQIIEWLPDLSVLRATCDVNMMVIAQSNSTNWVFLNEEISNTEIDNPSLFGED